MVAPNLAQNDSSKLKLKQVAHKVETKSKQVAQNGS